MGCIFGGLFSFAKKKKRIVFFGSCANERNPLAKESSQNSFQFFFGKRALFLRNSFQKEIWIKSSNPGGIGLFSQISF